MVSRLKASTSAAKWLRFSFLVAFCLCLLVASVDAQLPKDRYTNGGAVLRAFSGVTKSPNRFTVRLFSGREVVALGMVVESDGYILSKASELNRPNLRCRLNDGRSYSAQIVGVHRDFDLALLKIEATHLPTANWGDAKDPDVGRWVITVDQDSTPAGVGVVSVGSRAIKQQSGVLGISISEVSDGPRVKEVFPNSGADKAGLKVGDIITHVAGTLTRNGSALSRTIKRFRPGDTLELKVLRDDKDVEIKATLGHPFTSFLSRGMLQNRMGGELSIRRAGFPKAYQHSTFLKPNQCGGPLVNLDGKVVGINIARSGRTETLAIPVDEIKRIIPELKTGKLALKSDG